MPYRKKKVSYGTVARNFVGREGLIILIFAILAFIVISIITRPNKAADTSFPSYEDLDTETKQKIKDYLSED
ncbi:hypothetical protein ACFL4E_01060 [Candidatus Omnitrophota bacterium]